MPDETRADRDGQPPLTGGRIATSSPSATTVERLARSPFTTNVETAATFAKRSPYVAPSASRCRRRAPGCLQGARARELPQDGEQAHVDRHRRSRVPAALPTGYGEDRRYGCVLLLSDRSPAQALPALDALRPDLKHEPLALDALPHARELTPSLWLVDAAENPGQAWSVLTTLRRDEPGATVAVIVERSRSRSIPLARDRGRVRLPGRPRGGAARAPGHASASGRRRRRLDRSPRRPADRRRHLQGRRGRPPARPHLQGVRAAAVPRDPPPGAFTPDRRSCARCGATTSTGVHGPWTCTCGGSAPSSAPSAST